jgi:hypothetical protein
MNKAKKHVLGCLGLLGVGAMTCVAIMMPNTEASAATGTSDTIKVRVVGGSPNIAINGIVDGAKFVNPERSFVVSHENINHYTLSLKYTDMDGHVTSGLLDEIDVGESYGEVNYEINFVE